MNTSKPHLVRLDTQETVPVDRKLIVGRHPDCDYVVTVNDQSAGISGRHASIEVEGEYAWIEDLGSTNGTWVRGSRIAQRTPLLPGERFLLDRLEFEYRAPERAVAATPAPSTEKTVFAGRHEAQLPPVPVPSVQAVAPRLAPASAAAPAPTPQRAASRPVPEPDSAAGLTEAAPKKAGTSRPLMYSIIALALAVLIGAGIVLLS
jgi:pSer/pThr/pTyr-binding forkhead associated (FHA) protein